MASVGKKNNIGYKDDCNIKPLEIILPKASFYL